MTSDPASRPSRHGAIQDWLVRETQGERFIDNIFVEMCKRLRAAGFGIARGTLFFATNHPQWFGARILWSTGMDAARITTFDYGTEDTPQYVNSPIRELNDGARRVRRRLDTREGPGIWYAIHDDLAAEGMTDYVGWRLEHTLGKSHTITFASDKPGGLTDADLERLEDLIPVFALVSEIRIKNRLARTFLETYVGPHASEQILAGATRRGAGVTVQAAIVIADLRQFTALSGQWPRDDVIELLNGYFDALCEPAEKYGGEILKFMGDGLLAIFPLSKPDACENLLKAVDEAHANMMRFNEAHQGDPRFPLAYGVGIHVGDVMYGNIGSRRRLDFTVIGPAVNIAARLETLTKQTGRGVLASRAFVEMVGNDARFGRLGPFQLNGVQDEVEVFAYGTAATS